MMVIITYDINTESEGGAKRLRKVAKACQDYGQRVQNSVFECLIDYGTFLTLRKKLESIMNKELDSIRYYMLGNKWECKIEHVGAKTGYNPTGTLII
ncbi:MAG: CRISPR-associated endonuclease Cas2 [Lachnospiraceae bacterium]|nr:CRISPR-associated endonuclease Cas2 [Lachnospiraceae bacterium]